MIFDLHNDLPTSALSPTERLAKAQNTHDTVVYAFWTTEHPSPLSLIAETISAFDTVDCLFAIEDLWFVNKSVLESLSRTKLAYCGLTHNAANKLAGGAFSQEGLTAYGAQTVQALNRLGIAVDAAHLNRESFFSVADIAERFIDSHTGLNRMHTHPRNLDDEQVRLILERGGIIGLTAVSDFIDGNDIEDYARLIDCFAQRFGINGACIGTDFHGTQPLRNLSDYKDFTHVAHLLSNWGYTQSDINKLFYQNAKNYFTR